MAVTEHVEHPIRPPEVEQDVADAEEQHQHRDHLGHPRDRPAPFGLAQPQDRRDQRAGVADADEEHEIGDVEAPVHRPVESRHPQPDRNWVTYAYSPHKTVLTSTKTRSQYPGPVFSIGSNRIASCSESRFSTYVLSFR